MSLNIQRNVININHGEIYTVVFRIAIHLPCMNSHIWCKYWLFFINSIQIFLFFVVLILYAVSSGCVGGWIVKLTECLGLLDNDLHFVATVCCVDVQVWRWTIDELQFLLVLEFELSDKYLVQILALLNWIFKQEILGSILIKKLKIFGIWTKDIWFLKISFWLGFVPMTSETHESKYSNLFYRNDASLTSTNLSSSNFLI